MDDHPQYRAVDELADTIAALATPAGLGAIAVVRVSGARVAQIMTGLLARRLTPRYATLATVRDQHGRALDDAIAIFYKAPNSFTGEDVLEIQTHGGHIVARDVLAAVITQGARQARPGEFSERAFLNDKIDLVQAEAIADLIASASSRAARLARKNLTGHFSQALEHIATKINAVRVQVEADIDFADEAVAPFSAERLNEEIESVRDAISSLLRGASSGARLNNGIDVAIIGQVNVGKSTLLNVLADEERAIVSAEPGTTRDVLSVDLLVDGLPMRVHDTAGLRETNNVVEKEGVQRALAKIEQADLVLYVTVADEPPLLPCIANIGKPIFMLRNKIDLLGIEPAIDTRPYGCYAQISAREALGIDLLRDAIFEQLGLSDGSGNAFLARERHLNALRAALDALKLSPRLAREAPELLAEQLRIAAQHLGEVLGEYTSEDLLGDIFATFCVGK